jgi:hypothetical protein
MTKPLLVLLLFTIVLLPGCFCSSTDTIKPDVIIKHDTVETQIPVPTPTYQPSPCDTNAILDKYCNFDVEKNDSTGYWRAKYNHALKQLKLANQPKPDTVKPEIQMVYPTGFWEVIKHYWSYLLLAFFFGGLTLTIALPGWVTNLINLFKKK